MLINLLITMLGATCVFPISHHYKHCASKYGYLVHLGGTSKSPCTPHHSPWVQVLASTLNFSFLLKCVPGGSMVGPSILFYHPQGIEFPVSVWPSLGCCGHLGRTPVLKTLFSVSLCLSASQINGINLK